MRIGNLDFRKYVRPAVTDPCEMPNMMNVMFYLFICLFVYLFIY